MLPRGCLRVFQWTSATPATTRGYSSGGLRRRAFVKLTLTVRTPEWDSLGARRELSWVGT